MDQEIKQLEDAGIILHSMSNWASPILVVPKKPTQITLRASKQVTLRISSLTFIWCIDYHTLNSRIIAARQIKADGRLGKVVANYPLPTIDNLLVCFKDCQYFSTLDLHSGYYHIKLTLERAEKTAFIFDKGKWKIHLLTSGINLDPSAFLHVLGKVLAPCLDFTLNYLDDIIIFSRTWEDHISHLEEVFKQLKHADLKINHSKCKSFKSQVTTLVIW